MKLKADSTAAGTASVPKPSLRTTSAPTAFLRLPPGHLQRMHLLFLALTCVGGIGLVPQLVFDGLDVVWLRAVAAGGLIGILVLSFQLYARQRLKPSRFIPYFATLLAIQLGTKEPMSALGVFYSSVYFVALYASVRQGAALGVISSALFVLAEAVSPSSAKIGMNSLSVWMQVPGIIAGAVTLAALANSLIREEQVRGELLQRTQERERAEQALSESEQRHRTIVNTANEGIMVLDVDSRITFVNPRLCQLLGYAGEELITEPALAVFSQSGHAAAISAFDRLRSGTTQQFRLELRRKDGLQVPALASSSPLFDEAGRFAGSTLLLTDLTEVERIQQAQQEVIAREQSARAEADALQELNSFKDELLDNVSHELRTPLASIRSFSELLLAYPDDVENRLEFTQIINAESRRLSRLLNEVLDMAKIQSGHLQWQMREVDMTRLLRETAPKHAVLVRAQGLQFDVDIPDGLPAVQGDPDRLTQVLDNLLNNAMKFTKAGAIKLSAWQSDREVFVSVTDSGIGIGPEDQPRIFDKFYQVSQGLTEKPAGTGLGLPICKQIVEHHQGRIWLDSALGEGSTFTFSLPRCSCDADNEPNDRTRLARS